MNDVMTNDSTPVNRTPDLIAAEINDIKLQTQRVLLYNSIEIGRKLIEAKSIIEHGEWGNWLEESVDYSQSTANNLMKIFKEYSPKQMNLLGSEAKSQTLGNLGYSQAVALLGIPKEEREEFIEEHDVPNMSTRELQKIIKERDQAVKDKESAEKKLQKASKLAAEKSNEANRIMGDKQKAEENLMKIEEERKGDVKKIRELEQKLKEKPIEVTPEKVVEKVPEDIEKELAILRDKVKKADEDEHIVKFKIYFSELTDQFKELLEELANITDEEIQEKYKGAVAKLLDKMSERL